MLEEKEALSVSLEASRCPDATIHMRRAIQWFMEQEQDVLTMDSIEPSLVRSLPAYVALEELNIDVQIGHPTQITEQHKALWESNYDEDDFGDVETINTFTLTKKQHKREVICRS